MSVTSNATSRSCPATRYTRKAREPSSYEPNSTPVFVLTTPARRPPSPRRPTLGRCCGTRPASNTNKSSVPRELSKSAPAVPEGSSATTKPAVLVLGSAPSAPAAQRRRRPKRQSRGADLAGGGAVQQPARAAGTGESNASRRGRRRQAARSAAVEIADTREASEPAAERRAALAHALAMRAFQI